VRAIGRTGIWARYLAGEVQFGSRGGDEWSIAFGQMLEELCHRYARDGQPRPHPDLRPVLVTQPMSAGVLTTSSHCPASRPLRRSPPETPFVLLNVRALTKYMIRRQHYIPSALGNSEFSTVDAP
jgi:hypothetical protein